jgi:hypothetical protein
MHISPNLPEWKLSRSHQRLCLLYEDAKNSETIMTKEKSMEQAAI